MQSCSFPLRGAAWVTPGCVWSVALDGREGIQSDVGTGCQLDVGSGWAPGEHARWGCAMERPTAQQVNRPPAPCRRGRGVRV